MYNNKDLQYFDELVKYIELRAKAQKKGIDVQVRVTRPSNLPNTLVSNIREYHYALIKPICGLPFEIMEDGSLYLDYHHDDPHFDHTTYCYSLCEAEKRVEDYNESILEMPKFYGFIRQYEGEPHNILDYQVIALSYFAEKNGIKYETIFGCKGGPKPQGTGIWAEGVDGIVNLHYSCKKFFSEIAERNGILCIVDDSRLDGGYLAWNQIMEILEISNFSYDHDSVIAYQEYELGEKSENDLF